MLLLDTNVVSELRKVASGKAHPNVMVWSETVDPDETFISSIVLAAFSGRVLPLDEAAARHAARWLVPDPKPINDAYIAATAFTRRMTLVTRNVKDFESMGLAVINPWDAHPT